MIIYNPTWLANLRLHNDVDNHARRGDIAAAEAKKIKVTYYSGFYTPNFFARVGLFILTSIGVSFADGLLSLILLASRMIDSFAWLIVFGLMTYAFLEFIIRSNFHYRSGVDDALLIIAASQLIAGFGLGLGNHITGYSYYILLSGFTVVVSIYLTLRFADMLMAAVACIAFLAFIFCMWIDLIPAGLATAPFVMMLFSGGLYWLVYTHEKEQDYIDYHNCLIVAQSFSLAALYAAGNYYVIDTLSRDLAGKTGPVPFGAVFWVWTMLVPFVYIGTGIRKKDAVLLRTGLILIVAAGATFRAYYHILPVNVMLTLIGAIILAVVYGVMKYLKTPKHGFTCAEPDELNVMDQIKVESLIAAGTFSHAGSPTTAPDQGTKFGGGSFGGGGSGSGY